MAAHQILLLATPPSRCSFHGNRISGGFWQPARCAPTKNDKSTMLIPSHIHRDAFHSRLWPHLCEFPVRLCAKISRQRIKIAAVCTTKKKKWCFVWDGKLNASKDSWRTHSGCFWGQNVSSCSCNFLHEKQWSCCRWWDDELTCRLVLCGPTTHVRQKSTDRVAVVVCILQGKRKCENCAQDAAHSGQKQKLCSFIKTLLRDFEVIVGSLVVCMKMRALQSLWLFKRPLVEPVGMLLQRRRQRQLGLAWNRPLSSNSVFSPALRLTITAAAH